MNSQRVLYAAMLAATLIASSAAQAFTFLDFDPIVKWPVTTQTSAGNIRLNGNPTSDSGTSWDAAYAQAAANWSSNTVFNLNTNSSSITEPCSGYLPEFPEDGVHAVDFYDDVCGDAFGDSTLAVTLTFSDTPGEITDSDILFNTGSLWDVYTGDQRPGSNPQFDFRRVALHELGHFLGLDHSDVGLAIMRPIIDDEDDLTGDDVTGVQTLYGGEVEPPDPGLDPIVMSIEAPVENAVHAGVTTFRGWVISLRPLSSVRYFVNGSFRSNLDTSSSRNDIGSAFPDYPDSDESGFAFAQNTALFGAGIHTIRIDVRDIDGNTLSQSVTFEVDRFDTGFVQDNQVSLNGASVSKSGTDITINNFLHDGRRYRVIMRWNQQAQSFVIISIVGL